MTMRQPTILLTGFGPFPGAPINLSGALAEEIATVLARRSRTRRFVSAVLPTEWEVAPRQLARLYRELSPVLSVHFGVSEKATGLVVETMARNVCAATPDANDCLPRESCIDRNGAPCLEVSLPTRRIVSRLEACAVPARLSADAGNYICNALLYRSLQLAENAKAPAMAGFIHIPSAISGAPVAYRSASKPALTWDQAIAGGLEAVCTAIAALPRRPPHQR